MKLLFLSFAASGLLLATRSPVRAQPTPSGPTSPPPLTQPGVSAQRIRLACRPSLAMGNQPLLVVDGSLLPPDQQLADLNPDTIERLEVLKAPEATALFGSRAQYGIIFITTKRQPVVKPYAQRPMAAAATP